MKRLFLLRHAKSSWGDPGLRDHDRPLSPRGRRATGALRGALLSEGVHLDRVLCSSAVRARTTAEWALDGVGPAPEIVPDLYLASADEILSLVRAQPREIGELAVVGHDPGMHHLALHLGRGAPPEILERMRRKFPTGALAVVEFDVDSWAEATSDAARLVRFLRPKDLPGATELGL